MLLIRTRETASLASKMSSWSGQPTTAVTQA